MITKQLPDDFYDWIHARTFAIGAQMVLEPDSQTLPGKPGTIRKAVWTEREGKNSKALPAKCSVSDIRVSDHSSELAEGFQGNS